MTFIVFTRADVPKFAKLLSWLFGIPQRGVHVGGAGITGSLSVTGSTVQLTVQDCNAIRAVGLLEIFGVEMAITPA